MSLVLPSHLTPSPRSTMITLLPLTCFTDFTIIIFYAAGTPVWPLRDFIKLYCYSLLLYRLKGPKTNSTLYTEQPTVQSQSQKNVTSQFPYCRPGGPVSHFDLSTLTNYLLSASAIRHSYGNLLQTRAEIREYQNLFVPNESMTHRLSAIPFATSRRHLLFFVYFISCLGLPWLFPESGWPLLCSCWGPSGAWCSLLLINVHCCCSVAPHRTHRDSHPNSSHLRFATTPSLLDQAHPLSLVVMWVNACSDRQILFFVLDNKSWLRLPFYNNNYNFQTITENLVVPHL